jgi:citrate lyase subunit beta/citryl-CoA lyase
MRAAVLEPLASARTFLFAPAHEDRKVERALASGADAVILDLEDAVPAAAKGAARAGAVAALERGGAEGPALLVRINNPLNEVGTADLAAVGPLSPAAVMVPKAEPATLAAMPASAVPVAALVESAAGIAAAAELAADPRVGRLMLGSLDLAADLDLVLSADGIELAAARWSLTLASRLAGLPGPIDGVYSRYRDAEGLRREANLARGAGMRAKACIHPDQLAVVAETFSPAAAELEWADRVLAAWEDAGGDAGAIEVDGEMIDPPLVMRARSLRPAAAATGEGESDR